MLTSRMVGQNEPTARYETWLAQCLSNLAFQMVSGQRHSGRRRTYEPDALQTGEQLPIVGRKRPLQKRLRTSSTTSKSRSILIYTRLAAACMSLRLAKSGPRSYRSTEPGRAYCSAIQKRLSSTESGISQGKSLRLLEMLKHSKKSCLQVS